MNKSTRLLMVLLSMLCIKKLVDDHLLTNYSKSARPVPDHMSNQPINVTFGIELVQLIQVDDRYQKITSKIWTRQQWYNKLLQWDPVEWNNIKSAQLPPDLIWLPDIVLYNNADDKYPGGTEVYKTNVQVYPDGMQYWMAPVTFTSTCSIDIRYFPFDTQDCHLKFGSWTYDASGIDMLASTSPVVAGNYIKSSEWEVSKSEAVRTSALYNCCPYPYIDVTFHIELKRKPLYYVFNVILPALILVITVMFGFFLPPESGERISLTITILLAIAVFLQLVSEALPRNSDSTPILGIFYMVVMGESALSLVTTCIVLIVHHRSTERQTNAMPDWMRKYLLVKAARFLGIASKKDVEKKKNDHEQTPKHTIGKNNKISPPANEIVKEESETITNSLANGHAANGKANGHIANGIANGGYNNIEDSIRYRGMTPDLHPRDSADLGRPNIEPKLKKANRLKPILRQGEMNGETIDHILHEMQVINKNIKLKHDLEESQEEWRFLGKVLDRIFFWIFFVTITISCGVVLLPVVRRYYE